MQIGTKNQYIELMTERGTDFRWLEPQGCSHPGQT